MFTCAHGHDIQSDIVFPSKHFIYYHGNLSYPFTVCVVPYYLLYVDSSVIHLYIPVEISPTLQRKTYMRF